MKEHNVSWCNIRNIVAQTLISRNVDGFFRNEHVIKEITDNIVRYLEHESEPVREPNECELALARIIMEFVAVAKNINEFKDYKAYHNGIIVADIYMERIADSLREFRRSIIREVKN